ncbi:MAG: tetratricopeptide repeat protein, partial [Planctomycetota bacterium]
MSSRPTFRHALPLLALLVLAACGESDPAPTVEPDPGLVIDYPRDGSVFPPGFTPPTILWHDESSGSDAWTITVTFASGGEPLSVTSDGPPPPKGEIDAEALGPTNEVYEGTEYQRSARSFTPEAEVWKEIQRRSSGSAATLTIAGGAAGATSASVGFTTSTDPVGAPIFYRDVPLMPNEGEDGKIAPIDPKFGTLISWRLRDVSKPASKVVFTAIPTCANCHSFSRDGNTLGMDVDGPTGDKGMYAIVPIDETTTIGEDEVITWNSFPDKPDGHKTIGFLSRISPDGRTAMTTLNEALYVSNFTDYRFLQVFYPTRGILAFHSKETGEMKALPGADDTEYVHCDPVWFPDGKALVFARAKAFDPLVPGQELAQFPNDPREPEIRYDLYRIPFDGGKGGTPVPIEGASDNGMSNTFPKVSPDGKWIVFTRCRNGQLMRPDGRLWIVPAEGGEPREMNCNTSRMNSWHSFSPNGRWMVFSSKVNTPYTQLFLTHLDKDGNDTPPILIPNSTPANRASNIPEFVNRDYDDFDRVVIPAVDHHRHFIDALERQEAGDLEEAVTLFDRSLEKDPDFTRGLIGKGQALLDLGRIEEARVSLARAVEVTPNSALAHVNLGVTFLRENRTDEAVPHFERALAISSTNALAHYNLGLARIDRREYEAAVTSLREAVRFGEGDPDFHRELGFALLQLGEWEKAAEECRAAVELDATDPRAQANLSVALRKLGRMDEAIDPLRKAVE